METETSRHCLDCSGGNQTINNAEIIIIGQNTNNCGGQTAEHKSLDQLEHTFVHMKTKQETMEVNQETLTLEVNSLLESAEKAMGGRVAQLTEDLDVVATELFTAPDKP